MNRNQQRRLSLTDCGVYNTVMRSSEDLFCGKVAIFYRDAAAGTGPLERLRTSREASAAILRYPELRLAGRMSRLALGHDQRQPTCANEHFLRADALCSRIKDSPHVVA